MREVGQLWSSGKVEVADEHFYSRVCSEVLDIIHHSISEYQGFRQNPDPLIVLTPATGNLHIFGLQIVEMILMLEKIPSYFIRQSLMNDELSSKLGELRPEYLGVSLALPSQIRHLDLLVDFLKNDSETARIKILAGGFAYFDSEEIQPTNGVKVFQSVSNLLVFLG